MCPQDEMEVENQVEQAPETSEPSGGAEADSSAGSGESENEGQENTQESETPAYSPNYKYKVLQQEKEIPEKFRDFIKDAETEKEFRELFEKADGLDAHFKPKHEALQQSYNKVQADHNYLLGNIQEIREMYSKGDMDGFFQKLNIPPEKVLQYALDKINYQELPPEQKAMIDARRTAERQNMELQRQQQTMQRQYQEQVVQARQFALTSELARPEIKTVAESFDQRTGKPGAFMKEVINRGQLAWYQSNGKVDLSPSQAIAEVMSLYGLNAQTPQAPGQTVVPPASGNSQGQKSNTIPNVGGGKSSAPLKQKPRSIEDLKKIRESMG